MAGLLLAAGAGRRFGGPKALADTGQGPWVLRGLAVLAGLSPRLVVVGAAADQVVALLPTDCTAVRNPTPEAGLSSSLRAGLVALAAARPPVTAVLITLVDLPDVGPAVTRRLLAAAPPTPQVLARAIYRGRPGHPVLIGAAHWPDLLASLGGDRGARDYVTAAGAVGVECGDLATGRDVDRPPPVAPPGPAC